MDILNKLRIQTSRTIFKRSPNQYIFQQINTEIQSYKQILPMQVLHQKSNNPNQNIQVHLLNIKLPQLVRKYCQYGYSVQEIKEYIIKQVYQIDDEQKSINLENNSDLTDQQKIQLLTQRIKKTKISISQILANIDEKLNSFNKIEEIQLNQTQQLDQYDYKQAGRTKYHRQDKQNPQQSPSSSSSPYLQSYLHSKGGTNSKYVETFSHGIINKNIKKQITKKQTIYKSEQSRQKPQNRHKNPRSEASKLLESERQGNSPDMGRHSIEQQQIEDIDIISLLKSAQARKNEGQITVIMNKGCHNQCQLQQQQHQQSLQYQGQQEYKQGMQFQQSLAQQQLGQDSQQFYLL